MIKAFTQDIKRIIEVTPVQDVSGEPIYAKLYLDGCYQGIANTVRPAEDSAKATFGLTNPTGSNDSLPATIYGKHRFKNDWTKLKQGSVSIPANTTAKRGLSYDPLDYDEFKVAFGNTDLNVNSVEMLKRQYQSVNGIVVGGKAKEKIAIPCDFRRFEPDGDYSIVFVADETGVIGRDILSLFANDGYSFHGCINQ